jgi:hypothetical protein
VWDSRGLTLVTVVVVVGSRMVAAFASSRPVLITYCTVSRTASMLGVHGLVSDGGLPPRQKDRLLPLLVLVSCSICVRCVVHFVH